jgi:hypothetical protein
MKQTGKYLAIMVVVVALWDTVVIKPLKLFAVFLHELGHSLMSAIFGYGITGLNINIDEGGYAMTLPKDWFSSFMISNGGYLGSLFFALLILLLKKTPFKKYILGCAAILLLAVSIKYGDSLFIIIYSAAFAAFVMLLYMLHNERINDLVIDIIGIASVAYAIYDTFVDTILLQLNLKLGFISGWGGTQPATDAYQLQQLTHIPSIVWGAIWLVISLVAVNVVLIKGGRGGRAASRGRARN